jgi:hypothetical protein
MNEPINQITFDKSQSYSAYALPFGDTEIVVVSDGPLDLGTPGRFISRSTEGRDSWPVVT